MISDVFINYANADLREKPESLFKMLIDFNNHSKFKVDVCALETSKQTIRYIVSFIKCDSFQKAKAVYSKKSLKENITQEISGMRVGAIMLIRYVLKMHLNAYTDTRTTSVKTLVEKG